MVGKEVGLKNFIYSARTIMLLGLTRVGRHVSFRCEDARLWNENDDGQGSAKRCTIPYTPYLKWRHHPFFFRLELLDGLILVD
jgi:hypothetical protein